MQVITLKEQAFYQLRKLILNGDLKPGEYLTERTLVEMLGMSRTPIRAALERLDMEGLANYTPNKGLIVAEISLKQVIDFYDFRIAVECHVVRKLSALNWNEEEKVWFRNNLDRQLGFVESNDYNGFTLADSEFHLHLAKLHGNGEIVWVLEKFQDKLHRIATQVLRKDRSRIRVSYEDHVQIFESIIKGQEDEASQHMERHLEFGKRILIM